MGGQPGGNGGFGGGNRPDDNGQGFGGGNPPDMNGGQNGNMTATA